LQQVAWNLISNAVKFTPAGGEVRIELAQTDSDAVLTVSDTGIGIPADFLPHVFDRFSQKDSSTTRTHGGLGLGLAIAKQLVELHGGTLTAHSEGEGRGAMFTVKLPLVSGAVPYEESNLPRAPRAALSDAQAPLPDIAGVRALVIDDETDARELVQRVLEDRGVVVATARSGEEAGSMLAKFHPDIVLCDIGMPGLDGYQFMRQLRASSSPTRRIPAIALTAFARPEDRKRAILAGYQAHLAKPFDIAELIIIIAGLLGRTQ
jgi:CheY-like chemotaxis protein